MDNLKLKTLGQNLPRERLMSSGAEALSNYELIAILLEKGIRNKNVLELSKEILAEYSLKELSGLSVNKLKKIPGIGTAKACRIIASFELARRMTSYHDSKNPEITGPEDVYHLLNFLIYRSNEIFLGLFLDTKKKLICKKTLFIGTLNTTLVHPREIFNEAIKASADSVILAHNHPSGDPMPSNEDIQITKQIIQAGEIIGIPVLDHVIIGNKKFISLRDIGKI